MAITGIFNCVHCKAVSAGSRCVWCVAGVSKEEKRKRWKQDLEVINKELEHARPINNNSISNRPRITYLRNGRKYYEEEGR